jgi:hypothetical protein
MALVVRARYKPQVNKTSLETTIAGFDPSGKGLLVLPAQIIAYDDTQYNPSVAIPGNPADEALISVIHEAPIEIDMTALAGKTATQVASILNAALDSWAATVRPALEPMAPVYRALRQVGMRPLPTSPVAAPAGVTLSTS